MNIINTELTTQETISITQQLCEKISGITFDDLDEVTRQTASMLFMDGIAVAVAGAHQEKAPKVLSEHIKSLGGNPQATVFSFGYEASMTQAAYINGASMHVLDYEPMWNPPNHQLSTCLPAIMSLAEYKELDGRSVLTALVKGTEMMCRLRWAAPAQRDLNKNRFHPPGYVGPMGAAVAASHLLKLDSQNLANALGIVASRCSALWPNNGTDTKSLHCGMASANGLDSALLASKGFNSNPDILGAPRGYIESFFDKEEFMMDKLLGFGDDYRMVTPGCAIKMWPSQYGTHFIFTACFELKKKITSSDRIKSVVVTCPKMDYPNRPRPATGLAGKFSFQYAAALALLDDKIDMNSFSDERRFSEDMEEFLGKISLDQQDVPANFEKMGEGIVVTVELESGKKVKANCNGPKGFWGKEAITSEEHMEKVRACLSLVLSEEDTGTVIKYGQRLEELDGSEMKSLIQLLGNYQ